MIGHGQGMMCLYVGLDTNLSLAKKISLVSAMSPIAYTGHTAGMLNWVTEFLIRLPENMTECVFMPPSSQMDNVVEKYCREGTLTQSICYSMLFTVTG